MECETEPLKVFLCGGSILGICCRERGRLARSVSRILVSHKRIVNLEEQFMKGADAWN